MTIFLLRWINGEGISSSLSGSQTAGGVTPALLPLTGLLRPAYPKPFLPSSSLIASTGLPRACANSTSDRPCTPPLLRIAWMRKASLPRFEGRPAIGAGADLAGRPVLRGDVERTSAERDFGRVGDVATIGTTEVGRGLVPLGSKFGVLPRRVVGFMSVR